ncbi:winged helix-turn-helix domain-containing protein [Maribellus maritimus]|uniref:winged helix-turn-helix domain-containing protein n=1 Tax=Maribellus maritimus TaxID=2870838 RepID=UPI001EEB5024|nr:winged helix-turn-helix domain-containing protein [Maribellus maritimus]MCG6185960.1 GntR family transcriptional regulator [Maribellus maritimus]
MSKFKFTVDDNSNVLKFQQLVDWIVDSISRNQLKQGEMLPSVNQIMRESQLSRDTVFKAYAELKKRGIVESVPNRGYFVTKNITKVFLFLDTFKAYKEVLYGSFLKHLPKNISVDLHFHHYNIGVFEKIINESLGKYSKYIVMNFDSPKVPGIIKRIPKEHLLIIDWKIHSTSSLSFVYQNFGNPVYKCLEQNISQISKYNEFTFFYPPFTYHPKITIDYFKKFCTAYQIKHELIFEPEQFKIKKGGLYFLVSDRTLAGFLDQCAEKGFEPGREVGVISYNETPMKKYVKNGISVISTDFEQMGKKAAEFVSSGEKVQFEVPTTLKLRSSV